MILIDILTQGAAAFKQIMLHIASLADEFEAGGEQTLKGRGVYISCTTGNNRTGPFIALLLSLLSVPGDKICEEYQLSQEGLASSRAKTVARLRSNSKFAASFPEDELDMRAQRMCGARAESMSALLEEVGRRWGGAGGYFCGVLGLEEDVLEKVRRVLVVKDGVVEGEDGGEVVKEETEELRRRRESLSRPVDGAGLERALSAVSIVEAGDEDAGSSTK